MEVGENRVGVFYGTEKRVKEKNSRYIREASAQQQNRVSDL
jgi:hypothetical protein